MQWGHGNGVTNTGIHITLPIAYSTIGICSVSTADALGVGCYGADCKAKSEIYINFLRDGNHGYSFCWYTIGY